jgi:hypothetical protein
MRILITCSLFLLSLQAQEPSQAALPSSLRMPDTMPLIFQAQGVGDQIYTCKAAGEKYSWTLKAPDARLVDKDGHALGRHFAGPTWQAKDGSSVVGKLLATAPSPDAHSIPWLRLEVVSHGGRGIMSEVFGVQRLHTKGGKAPESGCTDSHAGAEVRVPYQADYYFYGKIE